MFGSWIGRASAWMGAVEADGALVQADWTVRAGDPVSVLAGAKRRQDAGLPPGPGFEGGRDRAAAAARKAKTAT